MTLTTESVPAENASETDATSSDARQRGRARSAMMRFSHGVKANWAILAFLGATFITRLYLADWNSYWNDEILSVVIYGIRHDSAWDAIATLADRSIHPPLYQFVLYNWMEVFGDLETATRTLSNVYITLASLLLYFIVKLTWSRTVAFFSSAAFAVMYLPMYYGLESRSYAQTIFLVTLSSFMLMRALLRAHEQGNWRIAPMAGSIAVIAGANTALLLTHYYNVFWLIAQAIFVFCFLAREASFRRWKFAITFGVLVSALPVALFAASWGRVFVRQYRNRAPSFQVEESVSRNPFELLVSSVVTNNLIAPAPVLIALGLVIVGALAWYVTRLSRRLDTVARATAWNFVHLAIWLFLPLVVVYAAFSFAGVERYNARYFVFAIPPLTALTFISLWLLIGFVSRRAGKAHVTSQVFVGVAIVALVSLFVPSGYAAAVERKVDWRGLTQRVVDVVDADPANSYFVLDTSFSRGSRTDYYFERFSDEVRADAVVPRSEERSGNFDRTLDQLPVLEANEKLILVLNHHRATDYPQLISLLDQRYSRVHAQLDYRGRGHIIFEAD